MPRYIDADKAIKQLAQSIKELRLILPASHFVQVKQDIEAYISFLRNQPTADVVDRARYKQLLENSTIMADALKEYEKEDAVEVVRCKDCRYWQEYQVGHWPNELCPWDKNETPDEDDYCSFGERREDAEVY